MTDKILKRQIGRNGPFIPAVGFGLMGASVGYGATDSDETRLKLLDRAWELGCTNWDTADVYGDSEDVVGKWFKLHPERRADIFLATKFGLQVRGSEGIVVDSTPEYCEKAVEQSLKRLGVDQIDLYYVHRVDPEVSIERTVGAMKKLVEQGIVKYLGLSEVSSSTLRRAHAIHPISAVQVEYNPWTLDIEQESGTHLLATAKELGVSVLAYSPLGRGMLTGRYRSAADFDPDDFRRTLERFQGDNFEKNLALVDKFAEVAKRKGCSSSQLVLAWLTAQSENVFVIPGTKKIPYLEDNFGASKVSISGDEEKDLRKLVEEAGVSGSRGSAFGSYVDTVSL
ncbi:ATP-dependent RNA helicase DBP9 [Apiospora rasikravindrae]|uniref:ATP-dependent RNA helicase DBP9 n=1 Tax=Apiospora rasikravindrae TaxID=990691 RepID=A0ABR1T9S0_9PEZI